MMMTSPSPTLCLCHFHLVPNQRLLSVISFAGAQAASRLRLSVFCLSFRRVSSACHFDEHLLPVISTERLLRVISTSVFCVSFRVSFCVSFRLSGANGEICCLAPLGRVRKVILLQFQLFRAYLIDSNVDIFY
jgi:hypothetical protein